MPILEYVYHQDTWQLVEAGYIPHPAHIAADLEFEPPTGILG